MRFDPREFPNLYVEGFEPTSCEDWDYNCIAWAAGKTNRWWWPGGTAPSGKDAFWTSGVPKKLTIPAFIKLFMEQGYRPDKVGNADLEEGFEKVAIYAKGTEPTHAARQLPSGRWAHKMGREIDLETKTLTAVEGNGYGRVVRILKRKIRSS